MQKAWLLSSRDWVGKEDKLRVQEKAKKKIFPSTFLTSHGAPSLPSWVFMTWTPRALGNGVLNCLAGL